MAFEPIATSGIFTNTPQSRNAKLFLSWESYLLWGLYYWYPFGIESLSPAHVQGQAISCFWLRDFLWHRALSSGCNRGYPVDIHPEPTPLPNHKLCALPSCTKHRSFLWKTKERPSLFVPPGLVTSLMTCTIKVTLNIGAHTQSSWASTIIYLSIGVGEDASCELKW